MSGGAFASGRASFSRRWRILASLTSTAELRRERWRAGKSGAPEQTALFDDGRGDLTAVRLRAFASSARVDLATSGSGAVARRQPRSGARAAASGGQERVSWAKMAAVLVAARLCEPPSELHIAEDWHRRAALGDLLQLGDAEVNKDQLYRALDHLLPCKAALEAHFVAALRRADCGRQRGAGLRRHEGNPAGEPRLFA
jgi:hypothetical protein